MSLTVTIFKNALDRSDVETFTDVDNVCDLLMQQFGSWPGTAKIYHNFIAKTNDVTPINNDEVSVRRLLTFDGHLFVVVWPEDPVTIIAIVAIALAAVAIGLAFLLRPKNKGQDEGSPNNELSDRQNKARPNERIPDIFGTVRSTPDLLVLPYKTFQGGQEFEQSYMCVGKGSYTIGDALDGTTPVGDIAGEYVGVYGPYSSPNSPDTSNTPQLTFGTLPATIDPIATVIKSNAVNGQVLRAPNSGSIQAQNNFAFKYGGTIICNDSNIDLTQYFQASTLTTNEYLTIGTNGAGQNADDPGGVQPTVGLAGQYKILSVSQSQIVLSNPATVNANWNALQYFAGQQSSFYHTFWIYDNSDKWVGPIIVDVNNLERVMNNFVVTGGLWYVDNKGRQGGLTVTVEVGVTAIDQNYNPIGDEITGTVNLVGSSINKNITGSTLRMSLPSTGPCQVRAKLLTNMQTDSRNTYSQQVQWRDLYSVSPINYNVIPPVQPAGGLYAFALPTTASAGHGSGTLLQGYSSAYPNGTGELYQNQSGGTANYYWGATFGGFQLPADLPSDAVITAVLPLIVVEALNIASGPPQAYSGSEFRAFSGPAGGNYYTLSPSAQNLNIGTYDYPNLARAFSNQNLTQSLGSNAAAVTGSEVHVQLLNSFGASGYNSQVFIKQVALVIYYTSASNGLSAPLQCGLGDFGNVTTALVLTAQSQDALTVKERKLNMLVTRNLPTWINRSASGLPQFSSTLYPTNNAADIACAMILDPFIGRRSITELDVPEIYGVADAAYLGGAHVDGLIAAYFGTFLMAEFCVTLDDSKVSFEESYAELAQAINCTGYRSGGSTISLFFEQQTSQSSLLFNHRNKLPDSETRTVQFGPLNDNDGIEYQYVEPNAANLPQQDTVSTIYLPADQSAINPKKITGTGVRNLIQAQTNAWRLYQKILYAKVTSEFQATQEANLLIINERILNADNTRPDTQDGDFVSQAGMTLTTLKALNFVAGHTYTGFFQHYDGTVEAMAVTAGATPYQIVLSAAPTLPIITDPTIWAKTTFILVDNADSNKRPVAFLVTKKDINDNGTFKLTTINYSDQYYLHDKDVVNGLLLVPVSGYAPQGYIGQGLIAPNGSTYVPPARTQFSQGAYNGSPTQQNNNVPTGSQVTNPPTLTANPAALEVNGASVSSEATNFANGTPAAPANSRNVVWQVGGSADLQTVSASLPVADTTGPGLAPTLPADATKYLNGAGSYVTPPFATTTQLVQAEQQETYIYAADTGAANAYAVALATAPTLVAGSVVVFKAQNANTGPSTIALNGGSAIAITKQGTTALIANDIIAGEIVRLVYDGTRWQFAAVPLTYTLPAATTTLRGGVRADGTSTTMAGDVISAVTNLVAPVTLNTGNPGNKGLIIKGNNTSAPLTPTFVQSCSNLTGTIASPKAATFPSNITAGSAIIVVGFNINTTSSGTCTDTLGNVYTRIEVAGNSTETYVCYNSIAGANTVSLAASSGGYIEGMIALEYANLAASSAYDIGASFASSSNSTSQATGSITTSNATDLLLIVNCLYAGSATTSLASGRTNVFHSASNSLNGQAVTIDVWNASLTAAGAYSDTINSSISSSFFGVIISFKALVPSSAQTANLEEFQSASGAVLSAVNALGQFMLPTTSGAPTNTPTGAALAFDPATNNLWVYNPSSGTPGWVANTLAILATASVAGIVKPDGTTITISSSGVISAVSSGGGGGSTPIATTSSVGTVKPDGTSILIDGTGKISTSAASLGLFAGLLSTPPTKTSAGLTTAFNNGSSFVSANNAIGISIYDLTTAGSEKVQGLVKAYPSAPFTLTTLLSPAPAIVPYCATGLIIASSLTGSFMFFSMRGNASGYLAPFVLAYASPTSFNSFLSPTSNTSSSQLIGQFIWQRIVDNGTTITWSLSTDGVVFVPFYSVAKSSSYVGSSGFNYIGIVVDTNSNPQALSCLQWSGA